MNHQHKPSSSLRTLQDILKDLNRCEKRCTAVKTRNSREFECWQRKMGGLWEGWSKGVDRSCL